MRGTECLDQAILAAHFARTRCRVFRNRDLLEAWQKAQLDRFLREVLPRTRRFRRITTTTALVDLPVTDKSIVMAHFSDFNTKQIELDDVLSMALASEETRDFEPTYRGLTVGLSSGTSGNRGVFLVSKAERLRWAGILLARTLPSHLLEHLLPWHEPLRIAFYLRANSNLYKTIHSTRIDFAYFDLMQGIEASLPRLRAFDPDVLVAPPSALRMLATTSQVRPRHIVSVADVLEQSDSDLIESSFGRRPAQIYQATEGFLGYSCEYGTLHLNETFIHFEMEWLDEARTRFHPIITDFSRDTQMIVRYRMNDILRVRRDPCPCGRAEQAIESIEGRADDVLWLRKTGVPSELAPVFPDHIRRIALTIGQPLTEFMVTQSGNELEVALACESDLESVQARFADEMARVCASVGVENPPLRFTRWVAPAAGSKRKRIVVARGPHAEKSCMS